MDCEEATPTRAARMTPRKITTLETSIVSVSLSFSFSTSREKKKGERNPINQSNIQLCVGGQSQVSSLPFIMTSQSN